jgi:hypothetical protein
MSGRFNTKDTHDVHVLQVLRVLAASFALVGSGLDPWSLSGLIFSTILEPAR